LALLEIRDLRTYFRTPQGIVQAVDGVNLLVEEGEVVGIVGESGCGKSVLSLSILRLLSMPPAFFAGGAILFNGRSLMDAPRRAIRHIRGNDISMIFQEPMTALNPVFSVGHQLGEVFRVHRGLSQTEARRRSVEMLSVVGVPAPEARLKDYPFRLSGGMRQRVMIAMALACQPKLLIADEPTTALDVTIQAQILELMRSLQEELGTAIMIISHDLGVIAENAHRIVVMYTGQVMEEAGTEELFDRPLHPYTQGLLRSLPQPDVSFTSQELYEIPGTVPSALNLTPGCRFVERCPEAQERCRRQSPELVDVAPGHKVACWRVGHG